MQKAREYGVFQEQGAVSCGWSPHSPCADGLGCKCSHVEGAGFLLKNMEVLQGFEQDRNMGSYLHLGEQTVAAKGKLDWREEKVGVGRSDRGLQ